MELTRVNNDINGNPRYVVHFPELINDKDREKAQELSRMDGLYIEHLYNIALGKAREIGGSKYRAKSYGGGIVFQSYNTHNLKELITEQRNK